MHRGAVGEHDCRTERRAGSRIAACHHRRHVVSAGVEAGNGSAVAAQHARIGIGRKSGADRDIGRPDRKGVKWRL